MQVIVTIRCRAILHDRRHLRDGRAVIRPFN
jgi:hypothetical protein